MLVTPYSPLWEKIRALKTHRHTHTEREVHLYSCSLSYLCEKGMRMWFSRQDPEVMCFFTLSNL